MIASEDFGYTLRCTGCRATIALTFRELQDPYRQADIKGGMKKAHSECDGFKDVSKAQQAIKAKRRAARQATYGGGPQ
jgi:hypothetical protein